MLTAGDRPADAVARLRAAGRGVLARPGFALAWRVALWAFWIVYFSFIVVVLGLRYVVLPKIEDFRPQIERLVSESLGQKVSVGRIEASWDGINPDLALLDVSIADREGRPALSFSRVEAVLSWWSVPRAQLRLRLLRIDQPTLNLRRDAQGHLFIAGLPLDQGGSDSDMSDWLLGQYRIRISGATLVWDDELRGAPTLRLEDFNFALDNDGSRHRFGLTAKPPAALASRLDLRGDFRGSDLAELDAWSGKAYAVIEYADLAVWRRWVDYPVALPHGRGAVRTWFSVESGGLGELTADVALEDVSLRLAPNLPVLELEHMRGRLGVRLSATGFEASGQGVELATRGAHDAVTIAPTDFRVAWRSRGDGGNGTASANRLDIELLARLAEHFPFDAQTRKLLLDYAPRGRIDNLAVTWDGSSEGLKRYALKARFANLALRPQGYLPGFSGLSGEVDCSERGGGVTLSGQHAALDMPMVFAEPTIKLDRLDAQVRWRLEGERVDAELLRAAFSSPDAEGSAQGRYRRTGSGPGYIDLGAELKRADARAVWRYMPRVVNTETRDWLRGSLITGHASDVQLILRGDIDDFPFVDPAKGLFRVTFKANDVILDYGRGWPRIENLSGDLRFEGLSMHVDTRHGHILGADISRTRAVIPNLDADEPEIVIDGHAVGPTAGFLRFIDQSPVANLIERFTSDMRASGDGELDLKLQIPLVEAKMGNTRVNGVFRFADNEISFDPGLPPLEQARGSVQFTARDMRIPEIGGSLFGGPLKIRGGTQKGGRTLISIAGQVNPEVMRRQPGASALLARLSGSASYRGEVRISGRNADLVLESTLVGLASTLPEPFAKAAADPLALRFEKKLLPVTARRDQPAPSRDQLSLSLGSVAAAQIVRRKQGDSFVAERGELAIGRPLRLPDSGLRVAVEAPRVDIDPWRRLLGGTVGDGAPPAGLALPENVVLRTSHLVAFGQSLRDVDLVANLEGGRWRVALKSTQAAGELFWDGNGNGKLTARLGRLRIASGDPAGEATEAETVERLPALDVVADDFSFGERRLGRLELLASNSGGAWRLQRFETSSPSGKLEGSGQWLTGGGRSRTQVSFRFDASDLGQQLERFGYPGTMRGGSGRLEGRLAWNGAPNALDFASLGGELKVGAEKGAFLKLDPGAAGKLLGLISLQGLPRRITLDFKDVFSEGFAFDSITGKVAVQNGIMRTDRLQIDGPSAHVVMRGEVDLKNETQRLDVNVQPELGGTAALGVALVNPLAGVATWVAHKVLQNPLNHMFGFDYRVTGRWDDPKVEKVGRGDPAEAAPRLPTIPNEAVADEAQETGGKDDVERK